MMRGLTKSGTELLLAPVDIVILLLTDGDRSVHTDDALWIWVTWLKDFLILGKFNVLAVLTVLSFSS